MKRDQHMGTTWHPCFSGGTENTAEEVKTPAKSFRAKDYNGTENGSEHRHLRVLVPFLIEEAKFRLTRMALNDIDKRLSRAKRHRWHDRAEELATQIEEGRLK
jgi:hypothetical protein